VADHLPHPPKIPQKTEVVARAARDTIAEVQRQRPRPYDGQQRDQPEIPDSRHALGLRIIDAHAWEGGSRPELREIAEEIQRFGIRQCLPVDNRLAVYHAPHRQLHDLAAAGTWKVRDLHDMRGNVPR
jgi:hypothetical protein